MWKNNVDEQLPVGVYMPILNKNNNNKFESNGMVKIGIYLTLVLLIVSVN